MTRWPRYYLAFLIGLGVSNIGNWLYLIALNVFVWHGRRDFCEKMVTAQVYSVWL